jgi:hypothetical protein
LVLISDFHFSSKGEYLPVKLNIDPEDKEYYRAGFIDGNGRITYYNRGFNDIIDVLVSSGSLFRHDFR